MTTTRRFVVLLAVLAVVAAGCSGAKKTASKAQRNVSAGASNGTEAGTAANDAAGTAAAGDAAGAATTGGATGTSGAGTGGGSGGNTGSGNRASGGGSTAAGGAVAAAGHTRPLLFGAKDDAVGIDDKKITLCAHAALTYGAAFNTSPADLNVYWQALSDEKGGVHGRKVEVTYENDNYTPQDAVTAATACNQKHPFFILGGIGFDQIPAVRQWAEKNHVLYIHHTATTDGTQGLTYSFSGLPSTEKAGEMFAELALSRFKGKRIGILKRNSPNWEPGIRGFKRVAAGRLNIVKEIAVPKDAHNYTQELLQMKAANVEVLWGWENAIAATEMLTQANAQNYHPNWLLFPFNLTSQTIGDGAVNPKMYGVAVWNAYSFGDYTAGFAAYADDMKQFERQYAKYRPSADLKGVAGDLLFLNWQGQKQLAGLLDSCGRDCTRNKLVDIIRTAKLPRSGAVCGVDFTRPGSPQLGGTQVSVMETYKAPSGKVNWRNVNTCVEHLI